jgi:apolipoprotein N-acyltransferase
VGLDGLRPASLALLSGILLALSVPRFGHPAIAWVALSPLLASLIARGSGPASPRPGPLRAFSLGLVSGVAYFVGTTYWTGAVMRQYGDLAPVVATVLMLALATYLAVYPAVFALILQRLVARFGARGLLLAPAAWVTTEFGRGYLFTGFPWVSLGYSQTTVLPVAQLASVCGVWGLSALVALVSTALVLLVFDRTRARWWLAATAAAAVVATAAWGSARMGENALTRQGVAFRVGLVQGNVSQDEKWSRDRAGNVVQTYLDLSRQVAGRGARLILWPESALPFFFEEEPLVGSAVRQVAIDTGSYVLFGSDQIERSAPARYFNSAFLIDPTGQVAAVYRKVHLVPFGEYVPLKKLLFFAGPLVQAVSDFSEGERVVMLPVAGHLASTAICYEVVYPHLAREATSAGSQLLTTITNDAWFGRSSAAWQHFEMASLRAVEQGRYLARAANTGISGIVDPYGRVLARSTLFEQAAITGDIRFLTSRTVYARTGDLFVYACAAATLAALLLTMRWGKMKT